MAGDSGSLPLVSIGLPVYNGDIYLRQAIESLLSQDYDHFELIISDNASLDSTFEICREYQAKDDRIRLYKNDSNIGVADNFNKVFHLSSGKYFMWAAHDDLRDKSYISKCAAKLEENPAAVLCSSDVLFIDACGKAWGGYYTCIESVGIDVAERAHMLIAKMFWYEVYGLIRSDCLRKTNLLVNRFGLDVILLMELLLMGEFVKIPEPLFMVRHHTAQMSFIDPVKTYGIMSWFTGLVRDLLQAVLKSGLENSAKCTIHKKCIEWFSLENIAGRDLVLQENRSKLPPHFDEENLQELIKMMRFLLTSDGLAAEEESNYG